MSRQTYIVFFTVLVDVVGFGIVIPILPFYATEFGVSPTVVTLLFASFSFFSFLSAPFLGALSDRIGRRPVIILSIISTAIGWFVFASAKAVWMLFLGRIIDGAAAGNFTSAQGYMVDIAKDEKERTRNLGILSGIFGVGFLLGPILGGLLSKVSHAFPFWVAGILASVNAVSAIFFLPESHTNRATQKSFDYHPLSPLIRAWRDMPLRPLYVTWTTFAVAFVLGQSVFSLFVKDVFGFSAFESGMSFTFIGVVLVINQTLLLQRFWLKRFDESRLQVIMLVILVFALLCIATGYLPLFAVALVGLGTGQAVLRVVVTSQVAGAAGPGRRGETIGILSSIMSASMVVAPVVAGVLFEIHHVVPYLLAVGVLLLGLVELWWGPRRPSTTTSSDPT
jgi:MFS transporter, DHA1 family, tetracycline resistance protein